jgi:hypothetical protein
MTRVHVRGGFFGLLDLRDLRTNLATSPCSDTILCVSGWDYEFTNGVGYGAELGRALTNNTSVTYLQLELQGLRIKTKKVPARSFNPYLAL